MSTEQNPKTLPQIGIGCRVELDLIDQQGNREPLIVTLVREQAADLDQDLLGANTPLAKAILGKFVGRTVPYKMGDIQSVHIVSVRPAPAIDPAEVAARRAAVLQKARAAAERTNAEMFAASYDGKWGDYNLPDAL
jgi:Transcription elongation factor, GreA/GreB, C-term